MKSFIKQDMQRNDDLIEGLKWVMTAIDQEDFPVPLDEAEAKGAKLTARNLIGLLILANDALGEHLSDLEAEEADEVV